MSTHSILHGGEEAAVVCVCSVVSRSFPASLSRDPRNEGNVTYSVLGTVLTEIGEVRRCVSAHSNPSYTRYTQSQVGSIGANYATLLYHLKTIVLTWPKTGRYSGKSCMGPGKVSSKEVGR